MMSLVKSMFLLMLAGFTLGGVQKRVYVAPGHSDLGGSADDTNGPHKGQHHGLHHVILTRPACRLKPFCGGSLLSSNWVISAAHCDCWFLRAVLNAHPPSSKRQVRKIAERHYCCHNGEEHDLMLLKLTDEHEKHAMLPTISLPPSPCTAPAHDEIVRVYSWMDATLGKKDSNHNNKHKLDSKVAHGLRFGNINVVDCQSGKPNDCLKGENYSPGSCICIKHPNVATVPGVSGGSYVWRSKSDLHEYLYGVHISGSGYLDDIPSQAKNMCYKLYSEWIHKIINK